MQGIITNNQRIISVVIMIYEHGVHRKCYPIDLKQFSKFGFGSPHDVQWGKSQSAASPFRSTLSHAPRPLVLHLNPQYGLHLQDWNYMHMSVTVHTTCLLLLLTSC